MGLKLTLCAAVLALPCLAQDKAVQGQIDPDNIALESLFSMEVTTASKFPEKLSRAASVMSVVTRDDLDRFGALTLAEALERVPGLTPSTDYFSDRQMVAVRGDQAKDVGSHVLILINGRPTREPQDGGIISDLLQSLPVNAIERIEVIRGPGSVLYGTNAFSGVINVITRKARGQALTLRGARAGSQGTASGELMIERGRLNLLAAVQMRADPPRRAQYLVSDFDPLFGFRNPVQQVVVPDRGPGALLTAEYRGLRVQTGYTGWRGSSFVRGVMGEPAWSRNFTNAGYSWKPKPRWDMTVDLTSTRAGLDVAKFPSITRRSSETLAEWTNSIQATSRDQVTIGALYSYVQGRESYQGGPVPVSIADGKRRSQGFYGQLEHRFGDTWKAIGGVQTNKIGDLSWRSVPRGGLIWSPSGRFTVKTLYGRAFRSPSIVEFALDHPGLAGNRNLVPENVGTLDVSVSYQTNRTLMAVTWFDSRQSDIVIAASSDPLSRPQYRNMGSVRLRGAELESRFYLSEHWYVGASFQHFAGEGRLDAQSSTSSMPVPHRAVVGALSYQARRTFTFSVFDAIRSAVPERGGPSGNSAELNPVAQAYHQINSHARFELSRLLGDGARGWALFAHGNNLANHQMWAPTGAGTFADSVPFGRGRTIYYGLEVALRRE